MKLITSSALVASLLALSGAVAHAGVLYSENFDSRTIGSLPSPWSAGSGGWGVSNAASSSSSNSFRGGDASGSSFYNATLAFTGMTGIANAGTIGVNFDLRIDNYSMTAGANNGFRVTYRPTSTSAQYAIGLGFANVGGSNHLFFYAGNGAAPTPGVSNAIGYSAGTGFASGFDLGTSVSAGTGGNFFNFAFTFDSVSKEVAIIVTNLANPSQTFTFHDTWNLGVASDATGNLTLGTGSASQGTMYVDNIAIAAVPEGQHLTLVGGAVLAAFAMMRRRTAKA